MADEGEEQRRTIDPARARTFTAVEDFWSEETKSQYAKDSSYTANTEELDALVDRWIDEGKVVLGVTSAKVRGEG